MQIGSHMSRFRGAAVPTSRYKSELLLYRKVLLLLLLIQLALVGKKGASRG